MDSGWRKKLVRWSGVAEDAKVLDCATGTGALAIEFSKFLGKQGTITAIDFSPLMLKEAKKNQEKIFSKEANREQAKIFFQEADMNQLPFPDNSFDLTVTSYGIRNVQSIKKALTEMVRVTKENGSLMILETGEIPKYFLKPFFYLYFRFIMPFMAGWVTGHRPAYNYLQRSSRNFPSQQKFLHIMKETGQLQDCQYKTLFFGASFIYKAKVK